MRPEDVIQRAIRAEFKRHGFDTVAVPNGSVLAGGPSQRARQMNSLKASGLRVGFPDLIVFAPEGRIGFVEVKREGTKQSATQVECETWLRGLGHKYVVMRTSMDVNETLNEWGWVA